MSMGLVDEREPHDIGATYIPPVKQSAHSPILSARFSCNFLMTNRGAIKIAKSVTTHGMGASTSSAGRLPQCCGMSGV